MGLNRDEKTFALAMCARAYGRQLGLYFVSHLAVIWLVIVGLLSAVASQGENKLFFYLE